MKIQKKKKTGFTHQSPSISSLSFYKSQKSKFSFLSVSKMKSLIEGHYILMYAFDYTVATVDIYDLYIWSFS